jgi:hypothetical protein
MPLITILREWLRITSPRFVAHSRSVAQEVLCMESGQSIRFDGKSGRTFSCLAGNVWITHDGDPKDVIVETGQSYDVTRRERMIVSALRDSVVRMR